MIASSNPFAAIADPTRRQIMDELASSGPLRAGELATRFPDISRPAVSKHLRVLRQAALVQQRPQGREIWYAIQPSALNEVSDWLRKHEAFWRERLTSLKSLAESTREAS